MGLIGKRVAKVDAKCNRGVFLDLFRYRQKELSKLVPNHIQSCELNAGEWGAVGSIITWTYLIDGKPLASKQVLEAVDEKNKSITYGAFEGDVMQIYKSLKANIHVEQNDENSVLTWTLEYEKVNEDVPDPDSHLDVAYKITKGIEAHKL